MAAGDTDSKRCCYVTLITSPQYLPGAIILDPYGIGANPAGVCNLKNDAWPPEEGWKENCDSTAITGPDGVASQITEESRPTYHLLNSGMFLFHPSEKLWNDMLRFFNT